MLVCPIYQLPAKSSQIYQQAAALHVCIFTYSHLCVLLEFSETQGTEEAQRLLQSVFKVIETLNPTKDASAYWRPLNQTVLDFSPAIPPLWKYEKQAALDSISIAKEEALRFLDQEHDRILRMSKEDAIRELIREANIENKIAKVKSVEDSGILSLI